jgi:hypothetical protein
VPVVGFIDDSGDRVRFDDMRQGEGNFALPRPMLRALASGYRASDHYGDADVISVTTLANPAQQVRLTERHDLFVLPDASLWAFFGTLGHGFFEGFEGDDDIVERRLLIDFEGTKVGGTFDLIEKIDGEHHGRDYKIIGCYPLAQMQRDGVAKAKPEYALQANVYAYMLSRPDVQEVVQTKNYSPGGVVTTSATVVPFEHAGMRVASWELVCVGRDWTKSKNGATLPSPIVRLPVDLIDHSRVENYLRQRIIVHKAAGLCDDAGLPDCTPSETWGGRRCASWCAAAPVCLQIQKRKAKT